MFKVGDNVRCVDADGAALQHGYVYKVEEVSDDSELLYFCDCGPGWLGRGWHSSRFVIAKPALKGNK